MKEEESRLLLLFIQEKKISLFFVLNDRCTYRFIELDT